MDVIGRQRGDEGRDCDGYFLLAVFRVDLLQLVGSLGQVANQLPGVLGEMAGPAVNVSH